MALVSVIIPTFNRAQKVIRAVSSVLFQHFTDYEIIVVDDGSMDDTRKTLSQFGRHITYISHPYNLGVSSARNTGIEHSKAPFIAFLDSDDYWLPKKLTAQVDFFNRYPERQICQTNEIWIRNGHRVTPHKKHLKPSGDIFEPSLELCLVSPSAVMLKRRLIEQVGFFDKTLPACEDYDLWLRISCRFPIYLINQYLVMKEGGHSDQLSSRYRGMDRFRIQALVKILTSELLNERQRQATLKELSIKCRIYGKGCIKRDRRYEGNLYLQIPSRFNPSI